MKCRIISLTLIFVFLGTVLVGAASLTVTKNALNCAITGETTAEAGAPYTFTVTPTDGHILAEVYAEVTGFPQNLNQNEGFSTESTYMPQRDAGKNSPGVAIVPDTDSPMKGLLPYKRVITKYKGGGSISNYMTTAFSVLKGAKSYSFGFWLKDETVTEIYHTDTKDYSMSFMMYYAKNATDAAAGITIDVPILALNTVDATTTLEITKNAVYESFSATAGCLAKSAGWTYYVINIEDIVYKSAYHTSSPTLYTQFTEVNEPLNQGKTLHMSNFTMLKEAKITNPFLVYPDSARTVGRLLPAENVDTYTIKVPSEATALAIFANAYGNMPVIKRTIGCSISGADLAAPNQPYTFTITPKEGCTLSQCYAIYNGVRTDLPIDSLSVSMSGTYYTTDVEIYAICTPTGTRAMDVAVNGDQLVTRTPYTDTEDITHWFTGLTVETLDKNPVINFGYSYAISKSNPNIWATTTKVSGSPDEIAPFHFNDSYIGANHGQSNSVIANVPNHGKTYADIGSHWQTNNGIKWNLLKIVDKDTLQFISDNQSKDDSKYKFASTISSPLEHITGAEHTGNIEISSQKGAQQLYSAVKHSKKVAYAVIDGIRHPLSGSMQLRCDYVDIVESYQIMNPAKVGAALRAARPEGGYTKPQSMAVGEALVDCNLIYRILPDGTILTIMDHKILKDLDFRYYGGMQHVELPNIYKGGVWRFQPKTKAFEIDGTKYDFSKPYNVSANAVPKQTMVPATWENETIVPDRQVEYYRDENNKNKALFAVGYLPIDDGAPAARLTKSTASYFIYNTKKSYPYFVSGTDVGKEGTTIRGIGYKKMQTQANDTTIGSAYTIPYGDDTYIYMDYFETGADTFSLDASLKGKEFVLVEKTDNVTYSVGADAISINVTQREAGNGYLVLKAQKPTLSLSSNDVTLENIDKTLCLLVTAVNENGKLLDIVVKNITENGTLSFSELGISTDGAEYVRAYLWDLLDGMTPVTTVKSVELN